MSMRHLVIFLQKSILLLARYWFVAAMLLAWFVLGLALLAPALMAVGEPEAGQAVYRLLAPHDHQLPQRSYFLFSPNGLVQSYSLEQILAWGAEPGNLRAFIGNPDVGYKMGLNHRMTAIFVAILGGGLIWGAAGGRPRLGSGLFLLFSLPLLLDGFSHMWSENSGLDYRESNAWAFALTRGIFPAGFYEGTTIGSLNWLLRTVTGLLFGLALVWFLFTYLNGQFQMIRAKLETRYQDAPN
jgi:hypothetical protein